MLYWLISHVVLVRVVKFCPNCGNELKFQQAKFCPECGASLATNVFQNEDSSNPNLADDSPKEEMPEINVYELGNKLEEVVETIYKSKGYITHRRQRITGKSGTKSEIDIIAQRGTRVIAIECKNFSGAVGIEKVRDFSEKLRDLELDGVFVSLNGLTQDAEQFAESRHIETMDSGELAEKWLTISVGRVESVKGQSISLNYALPVNVSFTQATKIDLINKQKVRISESELIFHPYFIAEYFFSSLFRDPTKKLHKFKDSGILFVDALDGKVLNQLPEKGLGVLKALKTLSSSTTRTENARTKKLLTELKNNKNFAHYKIQIEENYKVKELKPAISPKQAYEAAINFIIQKNTFEVSYTPNSEKNESIPQSRHVTFMLKRNDIRLLRRDVAIVPRWSIEFESSNRTYRREVLACSGEVLEDTMIYCPKHFRIGAFSLIQKRTVAVCDVCGKALCEDHVKPCAICEKWLCEDDAFECEVCKNRFCKEHEHLDCSTCNGQICIACLSSCPICHTAYSPNHSVTCDKCEQIVCPNCAITSGLIRKNRTCKKCAQ